MPIDFFQDKCKTTSNILKFGLCDDPSPSTGPAYIDEGQPEKWIGIVNNPKLKSVDFFAIDNCVEVNKPDGRQDSTCDGLLRFENSLVFTELKEREGGKWLKKGREQIANTIRRFKDEVDESQYDNVEAYVCNSLRPLVNSGHAISIQMFKDETGYVLHPQQEINI